MKPDYDIAIAGGGLAGLSSAILLAKQGYQVILFEKEEYPFHKVCGEYVSLESWKFLENLGLPLSQMNLPIIKRLLVTSPSGKELHHQLDLGGFGISRYKLDAALAEIAKANGVDVCAGTKVTDVLWKQDHFNIESNGGNTKATVVIGSFGKRSNLDVKWKRDFVLTKPNKLNNYIAVKYHVQTNWPKDLIALHNFKNGYCGISAIEEDKYCLCYLTTAKNLSRTGNSIQQMEEAILFQNPQLKKIFSSSTFLYSSPVTISQISFERKELVKEHVLFTGDAAGMITPLCGNGMSMALHAGKLLSEAVGLFLQGASTRLEMEQQYTIHWVHFFSKRLAMGRRIQQLFGHPVTTSVFLSFIRPFPALRNRLVKATHGSEF
ncbi:MAG: pyridine nucleotide-disulfide oxidoreductase [Chitinophagaceae bacterium]